VYLPRVSFLGRIEDNRSYISFYETHPPQGIATLIRISPGNERFLYITSDPREGAKVLRSRRKRKRERERERGKGEDESQVGR